MITVKLIIYKNKNLILLFESKIFNKFYKFILSKCVILLNFISKYKAINILLRFFKYSIVQSSKKRNVRTVSYILT